MKRPINHRFLHPLLIATLTVVFLLFFGCDFEGFGSSRTPYVAAESIRVEPRPVPASDTATFTVVLADHALPIEQLEFSWFFPNRPRIETQTNQVEWPAPPDTTYTQEVFVDVTPDPEAEEDRRYATLNTSFQIVDDN